MTGDHLPECNWQPDIDHGDGSFTSWICICDRLRACEARVHEAAYQAGKAYGLTVNGYTRGLDAARDAVAALPYWFSIDSALSAIDALRGAE